MTLHVQPDPHALEHNHGDCVSIALGVAEHLCLERGVQLTPIRHQVLALIWESHKAVKAYELLDRLKPLQQAAKPATVYRALDFLIEQGLIHRVESLNAFVGCRCSGHSIPVFRQIQLARRYGQQHRGVRPETREGYRGEAACLISV